MEILAAVETAVFGNAVDGPVGMVAQHVLGLLHAHCIIADAVTVEADHAIDDAEE